MKLNIIGIDASLSSTGIAIASCEFLESEKDFLFAALTQKDKVDSKRFDKSFHISWSEEIKEDSETKKKIAKVRKNIREEPKLADLVVEEYLSTKKIRDQVSEIIRVIKAQSIENTEMIVFIEDYSYHSPGSITQLAEMKGVLKYEMDQIIADESNVIGYLTANINTVKKVGGRNGNANKELICEELKRFGYEFDVEQDDAADAVSVSLAAFYAIYNILYPFESPKTKTAKERDFYKKFIQSLNTFAERIGNADDFKVMI